MKIQRSLILVFAAALTVGTSSATTVLFNVYVGTGHQSVSLSIDGSLIGAVYSGTNPTGAVITATQDESVGWHNIAMDYTDISGANGLELTLNSGWASAVDLGSFDATGTATNGLLGNFLTLAGAPVETIYGAGEGPYLNYSVGTTPWSGTFNGGSFTATTTFEEQLSGYIYFGAGTPLLSDLPGQQQSGGAAPEPASWWLMVAALPLMLFSKLRLSRAKASTDTQQSS